MRVGVSRILLSSTLSALLSMSFGAATVQAQTVTGNWLFDGNFNANIGANLASSGNWSFTTSTINGGSASVARFTQANNILSYLDVTHGVAPNGGGAFANKYTILMDVSLDAVNDYVSLYQTGSDPKGSDGDWFVRPDGGMGISGDYGDTGNSTHFVGAAWQRIALVIDTTSVAGNDNTVYKSYINGVLQNTVQTPSGWGVDQRYSLNPNFYLFADEDNEVQSGMINNLQVRNYAMSSTDLLALGGPTVGGIRTTSVPAPGAIATLLGGAVPGVTMLLRRRRAS